MKIILLLTFFITSANASYPEIFGASFSTSSIGNQANLDSNDPSNNYYDPSVLAFSKKVNALVQATHTKTNFTPISNIIIQNATTSPNAQASGNANTSYSNFFGSSIHLALPIGYEDHGILGVLGISIYIPVGSLIETNSGNPFLPEYVLYRSSYQRTSAYANFAHAFGDDIAVSLGALVGFQATADVTADLAMNNLGTDPYGSSGSARAKIAPSLGAIISATKKFEENKIYFTYQQEMKSNLRAHVVGGVVSPLSLPLDSTVDATIFYDPHTFRIGGDYKLGSLQFFGALEYQMWSNYKSPLLVLTKSAGVMEPSRNFELLQTQNTINPRIGIKHNLTDRWNYSLGFNYHQTPLKGNFSGNGNSIDTDTFIYTCGIQYRMVIWSKDVLLGTSFEYHDLKAKQVVKTANLENGNAGSKIGSPGYSIGGTIMASTFGIKFNF
jgi:long-subunit fatty acid transport protein